MNRSLLFFVFAVTLGLSACSESGENEVKNVINEDSTPTIYKDSAVSQTEAFQNLIKSNDGLIRGAKLNMSIEEIKKLEEKTQLAEETSTQLDYMMDYASLEEAEINYIFDEGKKLKAIELHVYPKSAESQDSVFAEFDKYFTEKIGKSVKLDSTTIKWENKLEDLSVVLAKRGNAKVHDVNISISKIGIKPKA